MRMKQVAAASLVLLGLGLGTAADAQAWGPPPPPPYGFAQPPPPGPPPPAMPGPRVVQRWYAGQPGYRPYHPRCWIQYRQNGWEMDKVCQ